MQQEGKHMRTHDSVSGHELSAFLTSEEDTNVISLNVLNQELDKNGDLELSSDAHGVTISPDLSQASQRCSCVPHRTGSAMNILMYFGHCGSSECRKDHTHHTNSRAPIYRSMAVLFCVFLPPIGLPCLVFSMMTKASNDAGNMCDAWRYSKLTLIFLEMGLFCVMLLLIGVMAFLGFITNQPQSISEQPFTSSSTINTFIGSTVSYKLLYNKGDTHSERTGETDIDEFLRILEKQKNQKNALPKSDLT